MKNKKIILPILGLAAGLALCINHGGATAALAISAEQAARGLSYWETKNTDLDKSQGGYLTFTQQNTRRNIDYPDSIGDHGILSIPFNASVKENISIELRVKIEQADNVPSGLSQQDVYTGIVLLGKKGFFNWNEGMGQQKDTPAVITFISTMNQRHGVPLLDIYQENLYQDDEGNPVHGARPVEGFQTNIEANTQFTYKFFYNAARGGFDVTLNGTSVVADADYQPFKDINITRMFPDGVAYLLFDFNTQNKDDIDPTQLVVYSVNGVATNAEPVGDSSAPSSAATTSAAPATSSQAPSGGGGCFGSTTATVVGIFLAVLSLGTIVLFKRKSIKE